MTSSTLVVVSSTGHEDEIWNKKRQTPHDPEVTPITPFLPATVVRLEQAGNVAEPYSIMWRRSAIVHMEASAHGHVNNGARSI